MKQYIFPIFISLSAMISLTSCPLNKGTTDIKIRAEEVIYVYMVNQTQEVSEYGVAPIEVKLSGPSSEPIEVNYITEGGTAGDGEDFSGTSGTLIFEPGETTKKIPIIIKSDNEPEEGEDFKVFLEDPKNGGLGGDTTEVTIIPGTTSPLSNATKLYGAGIRFCAKLQSGTFWCWGGDGTGFFDHIEIEWEDHAFDNIYGARRINPINQPIWEMTFGNLEYGFECYITIESTVYCKKRGFNDVSPGASGVATEITDLTDTYTQIGSGYSFACILNTNGGVKCWGEGGDGRKGNGSTSDSSTPTDVTGLTSGVDQIAVGYNHACALLNTGSIKCWGNNYRGQLGDGSNTQRSTPVDVTGISNAISVVAGVYSTCAVLDTKEVACWGYNYHGQLGNNSTTNSNTPQMVLSLNNATKVVMNRLYYDNAGYSTCALLETGEVKCWGDNRYGQLANGTYIDSLTPATATQLAGNVTDIVLGPTSGCAIIDSDKVKCWGGDLNGELGNPIPFSDVPIDVDIGTTASQLSVGAKHSCALGTDNNIYCWGFAEDYALGSDHSGDTSTPSRMGKPQQVTGLAALSIKEVAARQNFSCALFVDGSAQCWGDNDSGSIGNGLQWGKYWTPQNLTVASGSISSFTKGNMAAEQAMEQHNCVVLTTGQVECWGEGSTGQLGDGNGTSSYTSAVSVTGLTDVKAIVSAEYHSCAIKGDDTVACWGRNSSGELGDGTYTNRNSPVDVIDLSNVKQIDTSGLMPYSEDEDNVNYNYYSCALLYDGTVKCWGESQDELFLQNPAVTKTHTPVTLPDLTNVTQMALGGRHMCVLLSDGSVKCWGRNDYGQCGQPYDFQQRFISSPQTVTGLEAGVVEIGAGENFNCARLFNDTIKCWGRNRFGELGPQQSGSEPIYVIKKED